MLRFSIRDVFWLTLLVATMLGWWRHHVTTVKTMKVQRNIEVARSTINESNRMLKKYEYLIDARDRKGEGWLKRLREENLRRYIANPYKEDYLTAKE